MEKKKMVVTQSNHLTSAAYKLSLNEQRVLLFVMTKIDSRKDYSSNNTFKVSGREFGQIFNIDDRNVYKVIRDVGDHLFERELRFRHGKGHYTRARWVEKVEYNEGEGYITLEIGSCVLPLLTQLKGNFTSYDLQNTVRFKSAYSHRIYQFLNQWKTVGRVKIKIDGVKQRLELGEYYDDYKRLKGKILIPCLKEINLHSNLKVDMTELKEGRKVIGIEFSFKEKSLKRSKTDLKPLLTSPYRQAGSSDESASLPVSDINSSLKKIRIETFGDFIQ